MIIFPETGFRHEHKESLVVLLDYRQDFNAALLDDADIAVTPL